MNVKTTPWRKPIGDCGGINTLISDAYLEHSGSNGPIFYKEVIVHAYREVGTSLESALEIRVYYWKDQRKVHVRTIFENWSC